MKKRNSIFTACVALLLAGSVAATIAATGKRLADTERAEFSRGGQEMPARNAGKPMPSTSDLYMVMLEGDALPLELAQQGKPAGSRFTLASNEATNRRRHMEAQQAELLGRIAAVTGSRAEVIDTLQLALNAVLLRANEADVDRIRDLPGVKRVLRSERRFPTTDRGPIHIRANEVWAGLPGGTQSLGEGTIVGIIDTGIRGDHPSFADIGGDGYDHENPLGSGVYLGDCIDDPSLCNDKLIGIISFPSITSTFLPGMKRVGWDYLGHGTHVAATAAGNILRDVPILNVLGNAAAVDFAQVSGVAPHANIVAYQVCYQDGYNGCDTAAAAVAVEHAIENGIDVINYSIGGDTTNAWETIDGLAFLSARAAGIHVATSAGNNGPNPETIGTPANAPWITAVAAFTHDRDFESPLLTNFTGGTTPPSAPLLGEALTLDYTGSVVDAADYGDGYCMNPFTPGTFAGEIVVCRRGTIARVEKGHNVLEGGAGGLILINVTGGDTNVVADPHELPAIHLDAASGNTVLAWLAQGTGHAATITAAGPRENDAVANRAAVFTSRGPAIEFATIPTPHVAAPGVEIYAAWTNTSPFFDDEGVADFAFLNGTSMASPHVAGAFALLAATHPDWTPAEAQSALMLTANGNTVDHVSRPSTLFDAGSGMIDVVAAVSAGLVMDESEQDYLDADPYFGGHPEQLNMAAMIQPTCLMSCSWTRTVRATRDATWTASATTSPDFTINVEPASVFLRAGEEVELTITAELAGTMRLDTWQHGRVTLTPDDASIPEAGMPLAVKFDAGVAPEFVLREIGRDTGRMEIGGFRTVESTTLTATAIGLETADVYEVFLQGDPTPGIPFDLLSPYVHSVTVDIDSSVRGLLVEILEAESPDLDLFIAKDLDYDGRPTGAELYAGELCVSAGFDAMERCFVQDPPPGRYWIAVQNFEASSAGASDRHRMSVAVMRDGQEGITLTTPASVSRDVPWSLGVEWDHPMETDGVYYAMLDTGLSPDEPANIGRSILRLDRVGDEFTADAASVDVLTGETADFTWQLAGLPSTALARDVIIRASVPTGFSATTDTSGSIVDGSAVWELQQLPGGSPVSGTLHVATATSDGGKSIAISFVELDGDLPAMEVTPSSIEVLSLPVARINGSGSATLSVTAGGRLDVDASASDPGDTGPAFDYQWTQVDGPSVVLVADGNGGFEFVAPGVSSTTQFDYELVIVTGRASSEPAALSITVEPKRKSGGGAGGIPLLALCATAWLFRRRRE